jgi:hypothetical protein
LIYYIKESVTLLNIGKITAMKRFLPFIFLIIIAYGLYNSFSERGVRDTQKDSGCSICSAKTNTKELERELREIDSKEYKLNYIIHVINHGSNRLKLKGGEMEGGFIHRSEVRKVACYVMSLSGDSCNEFSDVERFKMLFTSSCGGCHGDDGRGKKGVYPDLTKKRFLGIIKREEEIKRELKRL